jgi:hypothetical protein
MPAFERACNPEDIQDFATYVLEELATRQARAASPRGNF